MEFRSPSGRLIKSRYIASKLQLKHEMLNYPSEIQSILSAHDLIWMDSSLVDIRKLQEFRKVTDQTTFREIVELIKQLKKLQVSEFFIENARSLVFCKTGVRLSTDELTGAWYRQVNFQLIAFKFVVALVYVSSIKHFDNKTTAEMPSSMLQVKSWNLDVRLISEGSFVFSSKSLVGCINELINKQNHLFGNSSNIFIISKGCSIEVLDSNLGPGFNSIVIKIKKGLNSEIKNCYLLACGKELDFELNLLNNLILDLPYTQILPVVLIFVQSKLENFGFDLNYDQVRLINLVVLNSVLVKLVAKTFKFHH